MPAFHQIGHDSENLVFEDALQGFGGAILSPLNYTPLQVAAQVERLRHRTGFVTIFDPHLYRPESDRLCLPEWDYYPKDLETADLSSESWWLALVDGVANTALQLAVTAVCSPAILPKAFSDEFYLDSVKYGNRLETTLRDSSVKPVQTVVINLPELSRPDRVMKIASIISASHASECLLVFVGTVEPRRELADPEELKGGMLLIKTLESGGQRVTVAFSSSDMLLWKAAGATNCATGKFFNLRRFTPSRFDDPSGGGGQLPYWFEESLVAFLRQSDLLRVRDIGLVSDASKSNPFSEPIMNAIPTEAAWLALSWRHFLYWFADAEHRMATGVIRPDTIVNEADANWGRVEASKPPVLMEERQNDGLWVRQWRRAVLELPYFK